MWLPFVGLGLLLLGVIGTYMYIYPGTAVSHAVVADGGADAGAAEASAPGAAPQGMPVPAAPGR